MRRSPPISRTTTKSHLARLSRRQNIPRVLLAKSTFSGLAQLGLMYIIFHRRGMMQRCNMPTALPFHGSAVCGTWAWMRRRVTLNSIEDRNARPLVEFHGVPDFTSGVGLAAAGRPTGMYQTLASEPESFIQFEQHRLDLFVQNYSQLTPNLTLNGGVRVELSKLPDADSRIKNSFNPSVFEQNLADATAACQSAIRPEYVHVCSAEARQLNNAFGGSFQEVFGSGVKGITPRAGFAWNPLGARTVIRGGVGMYMGAFPMVVIDETRSAFDKFLPVNAAYFVNRPFLLPNPASQNSNATVSVFGLNPVSVVAGSLNTLPAGINPETYLISHIFSLNPVTPTRLREPYSLQYNVSVERAISASSTVNLAYVGDLGRRLLRIATPEGGGGERLSNAPNTAGMGIGAVAARFPVFFNDCPDCSGTVEHVTPQQFQNSSSSLYNSLQASFRHGLSRGFSGGLSFTYSHAADDASDLFDTAGEYATAANSQHLREWGNAAYDMPFRSAGYVTWQSTSFAHRFLSDWGIAAIVEQQSGQPYTVNTSVDLNLDGNATDRSPHAYWSSAMSMVGERGLR